MPRIEFTDASPGMEELAALYSSVGWSTYTSDPSLLYDAITRSLRVVRAHEDGQLVGLARVVGDGLTIIYIQDILVAPSHQRRRIGVRLAEQVLAPFEAIRQKALITDAEPRQRAFYEALGFTEVHDMDPPIRAFVQFA